MTELEQAAKQYATTNPYGYDDPKDFKVNPTKVNAFKAGAEWQQKKDELILNGFFSREAVEEILAKYQQHFSNAFINGCGEAAKQIMAVNPDWFNTNYPPSKPE